MISATTPVIVAYGAAAEAEAPLSAWQRVRTNLKHAHHLARDRVLWKQNDLSTLDYRNYQNITSINRGDQAIVESIVAKISGHMVQVGFIRKNWGKLGTIPASSAMVAICGSGYLALNKENKIRESTLTDLDFLLSNDIPVVLFGVGINQILSAEKKSVGDIHSIDLPAIRKLLERCELVSVRDWRTQRALQKLTDKTVHMVADPALYIAPLDPSAAAAHTNTGQPLKVGFNIPFHGPSANRRVREDLTKYVQLLKAIQSHELCEFVYLTHYAPEEVVAQLIQDAGIPMTIASGMPDQLIQTYKSLDLHIGGMLHSCIMATSCGTPCIGIAYDVKHDGFFDAMGMREHCVSAVHFDVAETFEIFRRMRSTLPAIREKIVTNRRALEQDFDHFMHQATQLIATRTTAEHA